MSEMGQFRVANTRACDLFLKSLEANPKQHTKTFYEQCIRQLKGEDSKGKQTTRTEFTGKRLADITKFGVETYKRKRAKVARVRANRELVTLKRIYNFMIDAEKFDGRNPVKGIKLLPEPKERLIFLEHDEEETLLSACGEPLRTILILGIYCGLRIQAEALTLQWRSVDLKKNRLTIESAYAKNHESRTIPLNAKAREALVAHRERSGSTGHNDPVFVAKLGTPLKAIRSVFERVRDKAGVRKEVTLHTMRHTFASRLVMAGVDLRTVMELGGWSSMRIVFATLNWPISLIRFGPPVSDR